MHKYSAKYHKYYIKTASIKNQLSIHNLLDIYNKVTRIAYLRVAKYLHY